MTQSWPFAGIHAPAGNSQCVSRNVGLARFVKSVSGSFKLAIAELGFAGVIFKSRLFERRVKVAKFGRITQVRQNLAMILLVKGLQSESGDG